MGWLPTLPRGYVTLGGLLQSVERTWLSQCKHAVGGRPPRYAPTLSSPRGRRSASRGRADGNIAAVSHDQHVPTPTAEAAWRTNTAVSKAAWWPWSLTFWPRKWCPSHVWATSVPILVFIGLSVLDLGLMYATAVS